jgi:hypothetical protein
MTPFGLIKSFFIFAIFFVMYWKYDGFPLEGGDGGLPDLVTGIYSTDLSMFIYSLYSLE